MNTQHKHNTKIHISNHRSHSFHVTAPTAASSEGSLESQTCFVSHPPTNEVSSSTTRNPTNPHISTNPKTKFKASLSKPIRFLRRKCPCSCRESVQVCETTPKPKPTNTKPPLPVPSQESQPQPPTSQNAKAPITITDKLERDPTTTITEGFSFPSLSRASRGKNHDLHVVREEEEPRYSLEVFKPTVDRDRRQKSPSPPTPKSRAMDDDAASDASSDLFEIESFSTHVTTITCPIVVATKTECQEQSVDLRSAGETRSSIVSDSECVAAAAERDLMGATTITAIAV